MLLLLSDQIPGDHAVNFSHRVSGGLLRGYPEDFRMVEGGSLPGKKTSVKSK
jgi:hypothetical protein